jgi:signal transduction histidine kinase
VNEPSTRLQTDSRTAFEALPVGLAIYDEDRRLAFANTAFCHALGFPPGTFRPLSSLADNARLLAYRGLLGPGDPEAQAAEYANRDVSKEERIRRRHPDGRTFDSITVPLPTGGHMVCLTEATALTAMRDEAEMVVARVYAALTDLRIGLAVFTPNRTLALHNRRFAELLGLPPQHVAAGMPFSDLLQALQSREDYDSMEGNLFLASELAQDRSRPAAFRRTRVNGQVIDVQSEPLPDGGWAMTVSDITPLAQAEDDANRRAGLLDSILRQVPHGIAVYGADRRLTMLNDAYLRLMSGTPVAVGDLLDDVLLRRAKDGEFGPGDPAALAAEHLAYDLTRPQLRRRRRPDGSHIEIRTAPLPDGGHVFVVADITALTEAQQELSRRAELMSSIVSCIPHGVGVYGPDRRLRLVNDAYRSIMDGAPIAIGDSVDEIIEKRARSGEFGPGDPEYLIRQHRGRENARPEMRRRQRPNGATIDIRTAPLPDGGHISVVTDVTPLVIAEAELTRRAQTMDTMLANIRHSIVLWDEHRRIVAASTVVAAMLHAPPGLFVPGRSLEEVVASELEGGNLGEGPAAQTRAQWLLDQDRGQPQQDQRLTRDGRVIEVRSDPAPHGGFVTTYTDVTEAREAEDALRLSKSAAEAANAAKSRFLAAMSTELRCPLKTILGEADTIARDASDQLARVSGRGAASGGMDAGRIQESCETIGAAARSLMGMIDTILDMARLEAGRFDLSEDTVDLPQVVRACLRQFDAAAAAAEVALVVDLPDTLPRVRADERRLRQALGHVLSNALKFTDAMGSVCITARHDWTTGALQIQVQDTGVGIAEADLERVFDPFTQLGANGGGGRMPGAGLGLYVSRILMRAHGGDLMLRSLPHRGVTAILNIPANRVLQDGPRDPT